MNILTDDEMHKCVIKSELGTIIEIENAMWIYDSYGEFVADVDVNYCPCCGIKLNEKLSDEMKWKEKRNEFTSDIFNLLKTYDRFIDDPFYEDYQGTAYDFVLNDIHNLYVKWIHKHT